MCRVTGTTTLSSLHPSQSCVLNNGSNVAHFHHKWSEIKPHWFLSASFSFKCTGLAGLADVSGCVLWGSETVSTFNFFFLSLTSYIGKLDFLVSDYLLKPILRNLSYSFNLLPGGKGLGFEVLLNFVNFWITRFKSVVPMNLKCNAFPKWLTYSANDL